MEFHFVVKQGDLFCRYFRRFRKGCGNYVDNDTTNPMDTDFIIPLYIKQEKECKYLKKLIYLGQMYGISKFVCRVSGIKSL